MNIHHLQFLWYLRNGGWINESMLPDRRVIKATLLANGWVESRCGQQGIEYRITDLGLDEEAMSCAEDPKQLKT
ncbi:hypothetical protein [Bradyrhizobium japonicum]|uniref:hypothetical protein n=1 Tax=Bradyrhizobium japonicum TaxID=375 RepID=UPI000421B72C|nr:hypothetical protein [Bradyrhizobium japonicum]